MSKTVEVYRAEVPGMYEHPLFYSTTRKGAERQRNWKQDRYERRMVVNEYTITFRNPMSLPVSGSYMAIEYMAGELANPYFLDLLDEFDEADSDRETEFLILKGEKELMCYADEGGYDGIIMRDMVIDLRNFDPDKYYPDEFQNN